MKKTKLLIVSILIFLGILVGLVAGVYYFYENQLDSDVLNIKTVTLTVEPGASVDDILDQLVSENIIDAKQKLVLQAYFKQNTDLASGLKAGTFVIRSGTSITSLVELLQDPTASRDDILVTIPEGLRYEEIAYLLQSQFNDEGNSAFLASDYIQISENPNNYSFEKNVNSFLQEYKPTDANLEGYLFPETYFFTKDVDALTVINKQIDTLSTSLDEKDYQTIEASNYSLYDYLIVASMIEREAFGEEEKPMISDIIFKRLEQGVDGVKLLQIDATLLYIVKDWEADAFVLKEVDDPYNTYKYVGLPPSPISNPGLSTIIAAIYPEENSYFYYIHDDQGNIYYAENINQHNNNVNKYL